MIRSYRTKRRRVQQELELLNSLLSSNNDSFPIITTVQSTPVQLELIESAPNSSPKFHDISTSNSVGYSFENESVSNIVYNHSDEEMLLYNQYLTNKTSNTIDYSRNCCNFNSELSLKSLLSSWIVDYNVPHTTVNALLHTLKSHQCIECLKALPLDARTLLNSSSSKISIIRILGLGKYHHFGLKEGIKRLSLYLEYKNILKVVVGIDGLPLAKSSGSQFWPILILY
ncbi:Uncharacterized protein FWK35_00036892 [Aphis craccivora]|uniref:Uncharacterized protein n=1 Tax=Aphis craccivora TaxID=307492 RepID=A0A6G0XZP1_APHCR|nr:Uncharacterized protein FWK35_00036892 [Aphis craccivora]